MSADRAAADDAAIILGGLGSAFDTINHDMNSPVANVACVAEVEANDHVMVALPPLLGLPIDDAYGNVEEASENEQSDDDGNNKTRRKRIKYKDQGVRATYHLYLKPDSPTNVINEHRLADYFMTGVIT